jgi:uncharacterized SAM-binding protein YcdF (DUF218 family)
MKKRLPFLIAAALCFLAAGFLRFALIGYGVMALVCAGVGVCVLLYCFLPKKFRIMLTVLLVLGCLLFAVGEVPVIRAAGGTPGYDADWLIVLGAGVNGTAPSLSMLNRLSAALAYLDAHPDCRAVLSGGQGDGEDITEAEAMYRWLTAQGVAPERLVKETRSTRTQENLEYSLPLIPDALNARIAVCSSEYHLYRAQYLGKAMGYDLGAVPARTSLPVLRANYFIREGLGALYYHVFGSG